MLRGQAGWGGLLGRPAGCLRARRADDDIACHRLRNTQSTHKAAHSGAYGTTAGPSVTLQPDHR